MIPDSHRDLLEGPLTAVVTTIGPDGFPQSSPIWFMWDATRTRQREAGAGPQLWFSTKRWAAKYRNVARHPEVSLCVIDPANEFRYVEIRGTGSVADDPGCVGRDLIRAKHGIGPDAPDPAADARVLVAIEPQHVVVR